MDLPLAIQDTTGKINGAMSNFLSPNTHIGLKESVITTQRTCDLMISAILPGNETHQGSYPLQKHFN